MLPQCCPNRRATKSGNKRERFCYIQLQPATWNNKELQPATMSSTIRLQKICRYCNNPFIAKTTVTLYCSDNCAKRAYKQRQRNEKIESSKQLETERTQYDPIIAQKEFLTIDEVCNLINASRWTIYRLIEKKKLKATKLGRNIRITRQAIDELFKLNPV